MATRRGMLALVTMAVGLAVLACSLGGTLPASGLPPTSAPSTEIMAPAPSSTVPPPEPLVVTHREPEFLLYRLDGTLAGTRAAEGLSWARPNTAQVVGDAIYYVAGGGAEPGEVVRRVTASEVVDLDFTRSSEPSGLAFSVSDDDWRIAWTQTSWAGGPPFSQLWIAAIDGTAPALIAQTDAQDDIPEYYVLEPVTWLEGDLVFSWQVTGIGGYILFFGWSSLYRYDAETGAITPLAPVVPEVSAPCWTDLTPDGAFAVGACGELGGVIERNTAIGVETVFPAFAEQGQAGAAAYAPSGSRLAYGIARGDPENEAGQLVLVPARGEGPAPIASHAPGAFDVILWIDEGRLAAGYWQDSESFVDVVNVDGARRAIGEGRLIGLMQP